MDCFYVKIPSYNNQALHSVSITKSDQIIMYINGETALGLVVTKKGYK